MTEKKEILCITCPMGCMITAFKEGDIWKFEGASCRKGNDYALNEITGPKRMVTSTIKANNGDLLRLPVRTSSPVPLASINEVMRVIKDTQIMAPVRMGTIIIARVAGTDADLIATRDINIKA
jgi:CxxC motif-containing protein